MNSKVNILVYTNEKDGNGKDIYLRQFLKVDWTGWKLLSFPLAGFTAAYGATWDMPIHNFSIKSTGWNDASYEPIAGTVLNLDKIWLSKTQEGLPDVGENTGEEDDSSKAEGSVILADFDQGTQDWQSVTEDKIIYRAYRGAAQSGKWENHPANTATRSPNLTLNDWSDFETLNFWIYSAKATGETVHFLLFSDYDEANKKDSYFRDTFVVDWVGWKKITLDLNSDKVQRAYNPRLENIRYVQLQAAGWNLSLIHILFSGGLQCQDESAGLYHGKKRRGNG